MLDRPADADQYTVVGHPLVGILRATESGMVLGGVTEIFQDHETRYWIANRKRVYLYDSRRNTITPFMLDHDVNRIAETVDGRVWACGLEGSLYPGISFFDGVAWQRLQDDAVVNGRVASMFPDLQGGLRLIIGSRLVGYSPELGRFIELEKYSKSFVAGLVDKEGNMWLANVGIGSYNLSKRQWDHYSSSLEFASSVSLLYEDRIGRIWAGGWKGDVAVYDKSSRLWTQYALKDYILAQTPDRDYVGLNGIYQDKAGRMIFATLAGLLLLDESKNTWEMLAGADKDVPECFGSVVEDRAGNIWLGTSRAVVVLQ